MQAMLLILIVAICAVLASYHIARQSAERGSRVRGIALAGVVGWLAWGLLAQGFENEWPAAVGWLAFAVGAVQAMLTRPI